MAMTLDNPSFTQTTDRGPSPSIWNGFPTNSAMDDNPTLGWYVWDDFTTFPVTIPTTQGNWGPYKAFSSSGAAVSDGGVRGGAIKLVETTDGESIAIATTALPFTIVSTAGKIAFEARLKCSTITASGSLSVLCGLASQRTLIVGDPLVATTGALISTLDFVGFHRIASDGDAMDATYQENGSAQQIAIADAVTLVADTFVKVGFKYDPQDGVLRWYVNGTEQTTTTSATSLAASTFPSTVNLGLIFAQMAGATTPGDSYLDWWKCVQVPVDNVT